jgi:hypothetical protein
MAQGFSARLLAERPETSDPRVCGRQLRRARCRCGQAEDPRAGRRGRGSSSLEPHGRGDGLRAEGVGARSMCLVPAVGDQHPFRHADKGCSRPCYVNTESPFPLQACRLDISADRVFYPPETLPLFAPTAFAIHGFALLLGRAGVDPARPATLVRCS